MGSDVKMYVSGKITGLPYEDVVDKFRKASELLKGMGYNPINPIEISPFEPRKKWRDYMTDDIAALFYCDAIYMLKDWGQSRGARIEYQIAKELGLIIMFED